MATSDLIFPPKPPTVSQACYPTIIVQSRGGSVTQPDGIPRERPPACRGGGAGDRDHQVHPAGQVRVRPHPRRAGPRTWFEEIAGGLLIQYVYRHLPEGIPSRNLGSGIL